MKRARLLSAALAVAFITAACGTPTSTRSDPQSSSGISNGSIAFVGSEEGDYVIDVVDPDRSETTNLTHPQAWGEYDLGPTWSPDGRRLAFLRYSNLNGDGMGDYELVVTQSDGSDPINFTKGKGATNPTWSPDGGSIAFDRAVQEHGSFSSQLFVIGADGDRERQLTDGSFVNYLPEWAPDGSRLAFEQHAGDEVDVYTISSTGEELQRLTDTEGYDGDPDWSPDGSQIAFVHWMGDGHGVYVMNADGTDRRLVADLSGAEVVAPAWSPDGTSIAFQVYQGGDWDIQIVRVDSEEVVSVTDGPGDESEPVWSPDGRVIAYYGSDVPSSERDNSGTFDVYVIEPDGSGRTRLTARAGGLGAGLSWQPDHT